MKLYGVAVRVVFDTSRIDTFHAAMFHGFAKRNSKVYPNYELYHCGDQLKHPLQITRNGRTVPPVFMPGSEFVVAHALKSELQLLSNVAFLEVEFPKLIDWEYAAGDMSYWDIIPGYFDDGTGPERFIDSLPDVPELHESIGRYYELIVPLLRHIKTGYSGLRSVKLRISDEQHHDPVEADLSEQMIRENPMIRAPGGHLLAEAAFSIMALYLDPDYFAIRSFDI